MLRKTPLNAIHRSLGGRMANVHGWDMPRHYSAGAGTERLAVLQRCGLFDACYEGAVRVTGPEARELLEKSLELERGIEKLQKGRCCLGTLKTEQGCSSDECAVYQLDDGGRDFLLTADPDRTFYVVDCLDRNKQRRQRPAQYQEPLQASAEGAEGAFGRLKLRGPKSGAVLRGCLMRPELLDGLEDGCFIGNLKDSGVFLKGNLPVMISRLDGAFNIFCPVEKASDVWEALLKAGGSDVLPCGVEAAKMEEQGMLDSAYYQKADEILARYPKQESSLIPIIHDVQEEYNYLPPDLLPYIARQIGITETKAYSVASFYEHFSFEPKGKYIIRVCDGTACHVRNSLPVLQRLREELGLSAQKHTTDDGLFTVETVSCLGACSLAPAMMVGDEVHPAMTPDKASALIKELRGDNHDKN